MGGERLHVVEAAESCDCWWKSDWARPRAVTYGETRVFAGRELAGPKTWNCMGQILPGSTCHHAVVVGLATPPTRLQTLLRSSPSRRRRAGLSDKLVKSIGVM